MKKLTLLLLTLLLLIGSCGRPKVQTTAEGLIINLEPTEENQVRKIRLEVIEEDIIRVTATAEEKFSDDTSLAVIRNAPGGMQYKWEFINEDSLVFRTETVHVFISTKTGAVTFRDAEGNLILEEEKGGGKHFEPLTVDGTALYTIRQVFESPGDEAFYGLGQHQNGQMNYKGQDVELAQHNIIIAVPFLYSSKNYGILWDNYSITNFGDPREYQPLNSLKLYDKDGEPGGLTATYYQGDSVFMQQTEDIIDYQVVADRDKWPEGFDLQNGHVIWEGFIDSDSAGIHKLRLFAAGYYQLWLEGEPVIDKWRQNWNPWFDIIRGRLSPGEKIPVKIEFHPDGGHYIALEHLDPADPEQQQKLSLTSEAGEEIDYYFVYGTNADEVISGYRRLTGKASMMPSWAMGLWQSRERYQTQEELLEVLAEFREREVPIDNIVLDWFYWPEDQWGSHDFDTSRFPDPQGMVDAVHDRNARIMISIWPKFYIGTEHFKEMQEGGYLYRGNLEKEVKDWVGYVSTFYDATNPGGQELYWEQVNDKLNFLGIDAWWLDATEPDLESNIGQEEQKARMYPMYAGPSTQYYNPYSLLHSKGFYEGLREVNTNHRAFILTRSAFAGQQRYGAVSWSGDVASRWDDLANQIPAGLNFSIAGIPFWTHDIGGFSTESRYQDATGEDLREWRELMTRWYQFGAFCPLFRVHGQYPYREIFNVAPVNHLAYRSMLYYDKLRYRMMPYIYTLNGLAWLEDYTLMRPLVMDFRRDPEVYGIPDQYLFGPALMVCPVTRDRATEREVYLPSGSGWYNLYDGRFHEGGKRIIAEAPYEKIPVFVPEGAIIPYGPELQYTGEKPADPLTVYVYAGKDGKFTLYEDEGTNYNYEEGVYSLLPFTYDDESKSLTIGTREGEFPGMLESRTIRVVFVSSENPVGIDSEEVEMQSVEYTGEEVVVKFLSS